MERQRDLSWLKDGRVLAVCTGTLVAGFLIGLLIFGSPWHLPPAWGDVPTWIEALATVGLLAGAIITAWYAIKAFRTQSDLLAEQRKSQRLEVRSPRS
jgi:protein-S-isoprenylcysteine O-methyltransferase Ste14